MANENFVVDALTEVADALETSNETLAANTGAIRSLRDIIADRLAEQGVENAAGVQVTIGNAEVVNIISDSNAALDRQVDASQVSVKPFQSAGAGM